MNKTVEIHSVLAKPTDFITCIQDETGKKITVQFVRFASGTHDRGMFFFGDSVTIYILSGSGAIFRQGRITPIWAGMYAAFSGDTSLIGDMTALVITQRGSFPMNTVGGPIETTGRLKYIDGCRDTLLIPPYKLGMPCLNALYFPKGTDQTAHTHPSERIGIVVSGVGECVHEEDGQEVVTPLRYGSLFILHAEAKHRFRTTIGSDLTVIAYHPDSDYGLTDEVPPMINRYNCQWCFSEKY